MASPQGFEQRSHVIGVTFSRIAVGALLKIGCKCARVEQRDHVRDDCVNPGKKR